MRRNTRERRPETPYRFDEIEWICSPDFHATSNTVSRYPEVEPCRPEPARVSGKLWKNAFPKGIFQGQVIELSHNLLRALACFFAPIA